MITVKQTFRSKESVGVAQLGETCRGVLHYALRVHFRDRLRWIVWKRCSGSLRGHPWEVSLSALWSSLRERGTIGGTSCCGRVAVTQWRSCLQAAGRSAQAGRRPTSARPQFIAARPGGAVCVHRLTGKRSAFVTRSPLLQGLHMTLWTQWSLSTTAVWWIGQKDASCRFCIWLWRDSRLKVHWVDLNSGHFCRFVSDWPGKRFPLFYTLKSP